ncbi:F-box/LRR-repeat protein fbxl-1-like [Maniola jurtina]|uniref:F-box/LRR-repeat protein 7-like n=1 Tax=Aphantopus hyperantus TaxID=2795564 RepID=UPI00156A3E7C|nr:F-box/LRR-repeat protein fbxl-1-like [Maniola hyperantus]XP_034828390.1 F-box/LRR-repeat protein fbxl-1-like [Maniola hyperantus]XP_045767627.1 F-box/LRR-repeat protein fbxl-1-like [Maniola jurtina]XP_045767628.1 F-box/LRR-repeat protein fbxl-1-like [Maniola jurtina]
MVHLEMTGVQPGSHSLTINDLPNELLIYIFSMIDFESVLAVAQVCVRWQQLCLTPCIWENTRLIVCMKNYVRVSDSVVPFVAKYLKKVKLQYFKLYSQVRASLISYCPNLTHLEISISLVDSCIFDDLGHWPNLKFLSFRNSLIAQTAENANGNFVYHLPFEKLKYLETLILSNFALTHSSLYSMLQCVNLVSINMEKMKNIPADFLESLLLTKQTTLRALHIYGDILNDDIISLISKCKALQVLHIMTCKTLFDSSLLHLYRLKSLRSLKLRHGYFSTNALLAYFSKNLFQHLTYLSLSRCLHVTMQVAKVIKTSAPNLKELSFYLCPFIVAGDFKRAELERMYNKIELLLD